MNRRIIATVISFSLSVLTVAIALVTVDVAIAQTPVSAPTVQPTATSVPYVTQTELLAAYKEVLESSQAAVENVRSTTKTVLWLVGAAYTLLTLEGLGSLWLTQKATREVVQARQQAQESSQEVAQVKSLVSGIQSTYKGLKEEEKRIQEQIEAISDELSRLQADTEWYGGLMLVSQVKNHALRLFHEDEIDWKDAANSLREQLKHRDPIARLEIVRAFQAWAELDPRSAPELGTRIEKILESVVGFEPERVVRLEAERALKALRRRSKGK